MTPSVDDAAGRGAERPIPPVRGTADWLPGGFARLEALEGLLLDRFARAGYVPMRTPVLEYTDLHERKSGAGIVAKLFELSGSGPDGVCLRPELTAGIVRAYTHAEGSVALPWRVAHSGPVFRHETPRPGRLREFQQVGVERLGDSGPFADGEALWLADWALSEAGVEGATIRIGHVGLILETLRRSGLPGPTRAALVEMLSESATEGKGVESLERALGQLAGWLQGAPAPEVPASVERADDGGIDRLFRTLVPVVTGRRSGHEIIHRLRRKWDLGHGLHDALGAVRERIHALAGLKGRPADVLDRLAREHEALAPDSIASLRALVRTLEDYGVDLDRVELDLGFGRGIGFYSQMIFELAAPTPEGPVEVCGGGRYDGLARVLGSARDDRGVGFAFGLERLLHVLDARGQGGDEGPPPSGFAVVATRPEAVPHAIRLATTLRAGGARVVLETGRSVEETVAHARSLRLARAVAVAGPPDEEGSLVLHDLATGIVSRTEARALKGLIAGREGGPR